MKPPADEELFLRWCALAPPPMITAHLETLQCSVYHVSKSQLPDGAVATILARNDPFLDFAVATYSDDAATLKPLWDRGDAALRRAIMANRNRSLDFCSDEDFRQILLTGSPDELEMTLTVPGPGRNSRGRDWLKDLYRRKGQFYGDLPKERWRLVALAALGNPMLKIRRSDTMGYDPGVYAWSLLMLLPPDIQTAWELERCFAAFGSYDPSVDIEDVKGESPDERSTRQKEAEAALFLETMRRWTFEDELEELRELGIEWPTAGPSLRLTVASKVPSNDTAVRPIAEGHNDPYVRAGAYRSKAFRTPAEVDTAIAAIGVLFFAQCHSNPAFHSRRNPELVHHVRQCFYDFEFSAGGLSYQATEHIRSRWPRSADDLAAKAPQEFFSWDQPVVLPPEPS